MMDSANPGRSQYRPQGLGEEIANAVSHGAGVLLAIAGMVALLVRASQSGSTLAVVSVALYGASMIILYLVSCLYHSLAAPRGKKILQIMDHCSIFLLILGSYIPITLILIGGWIGWAMFGVITACAVLGIVLNSVSFQRWRKLSMVLYVVMGWLGLFTLPLILRAASLKGLILLLLGGVSYTLGIVFYRQRERKYRHFIWHLFVLGGTILHFIFIYYYCCGIA